MWIAITATDVESVMAGPELEAVRRAAGDADGDEADMLPAIITTVTNEIRAHIEDCSENRLGAAGTLPERVHHHALAVIRYRLLSRLDMGVGEGRQKEYDDATAFFRRVSECRVKIEQPDDADVVREANTPTVDVVTQTTQEMGKASLKGLF
jgi:Protein of unknown function (DUF1320)